MGENYILPCLDTRHLDLYRSSRAHTREHIFHPLLPAPRSSFAFRANEMGQFLATTATTSVQVWVFERLLLVGGGPQKETSVS